MSRANRKWCEREADVVRSLRTGVFSSELLTHVLNCGSCKEAQAMSEVLLQAASLVDVKHEPPSAGLVWRRVEARKKEVALRRATRPLLVMRALSVFCLLLSAPWLLSFVSLPSVTQVMSGWSVARDGIAEAGAAIAVLGIVIAIGACYLLYDGRRAGVGVPST